MEAYTQKLSVNQVRQMVCQRMLPAPVLNRDCWQVLRPSVSEEARLLLQFQLG
ncbi:hypothetical protein SERLADRAFT_386535 [Serpula lacrymans var. lacrymans S7.9]|uniref:Uncharacterized protein n=1 Tax=Serpula lacrymans var. lacrymans (strain S7.9) TaxID=578457 RepID=F8NTY9_SERL9|nr:uncharacterized protein SERLADRAFT_386535 [Serpula lacrymans var. lacrymans S7.9]EGO25116.1 hypothetical protein SERLADRAFT_386535 [Serpula lacrymans var. lacrymans S7.9]